MDATQRNARGNEMKLQQHVINQVIDCLAIAARKKENPEWVWSTVMSPQQHIWFIAWLENSQDPIAKEPTLPREKFTAKAMEIRKAAN